MVFKRLTSARFLRFVFPIMPVISRSQLRRSLLGSNQSEMPVHLLAAIYASSFPFHIHDPCLCVSGAYKTPPIDALWKIVYGSILRELHTPNLAVLQSSILYLQRFPQKGLAAVGDSAFVWSFFGASVNLAHTLGLQLDCRRWGIPCWEKRIRRRLWWIVYVEDKWRSLLAGRPPLIQSMEWDTSPIEISDFEFDNPPNDLLDDEWLLDDGTLFKNISELAPVAEKLQTTF